jgi:hypothetical protein
VAKYPRNRKEPRGSSKAWRTILSFGPSKLLTGTTPLEAERLRTAEMQRLLREEEPPRRSTRLSSLGDSDRAVAWLKQAVAAGYKNAPKLKKDTDLDALRGREDLKKLIAELEGTTSGRDEG